MSKQKQKGLVPPLRFPEFRDKGEWEEKRLGDFSIIVRGGSPRPIDEYITKDANGLNWLKIGDIDKESKFVKSTQEKVIPAALSKTRVVNSGDLILSNSMSFGRPYILEIQTCIHDGWIAVSQINNSLDRDYLYYLMMTSASQTYFSNNAAGSGVQNLNADIIKLLPVSYPHKKEQQKIADCLTSVDELITAQTQKLDSLKTHKNGLMQQLFPAEGEAVPRLRFPEYQDKGEWMEKRLGDVGSVRMCKRIFKEQTSPRGDIPFYKIGTFGGIPDAYISREIFENYRNKFPFPKNGAVLISAAGTIGRTIVYKGEVEYFQDSNIVWLDNNENLIVDNFLFYLYQLINWAPSVGAIQRLYNENILGAQVKFPSIPEQQKITDCLSSIDELITVQTQKLDALKAHKKGLMQQLFPAVDEAG
jgi:type I restriction enzyme S subunit